MKYIILDFTKCRYLGEIHEILKNEFKFGEHYGENLDALWDCLDNYCDFDLCVYVKGTASVSDEIKEYMNKIWDIFCRVHSTTPNMVFERIS